MTKIGRNIEKTLENLHQSHLGPNTVKNPHISGILPPKSQIPKVGQTLSKIPTFLRFGPERAKLATLVCVKGSCVKTNELASNLA